MNFAVSDRFLLDNKKPFVISGPCSAETEEQVFETCRQLSTTNQVSVIRAGIWKPRTRPNAFEGIGAPALSWLKSAGLEFNIPVATEVANANHVEACLKADIDILWIGARTTANPFSVQEIADALKGCDIPVLIKNPINPDLQLWIGALERISQAGITQLGAIHRGFSSFEKTPYRNQPKWEIPIELKSRFPNLSIICDPSHIAGNRELLSLISQKAMDMGMAGLMIESHLDPDNAWSDANQQITPHSLSQLLNELIIRDVEPMEGIPSGELEFLRKQIDEVDSQLIEILSKRMDLSSQIGEYKRDHQVTILQIKRWEEIKRTRGQLASSIGLGDNFTRSLLQLIHKESIRTQTEVMNTPVKIADK